VKPTFSDLFIRPRNSDTLEEFARLTHLKWQKIRYTPLSYPSYILPKDTETRLQELADLKEDTFGLKKRNGEERAKFSFIDLFAGIGGFRLAGENTGGICRFSSEKDKYARISYHHNFGEMPFGDINFFTNSENIHLIPDHDILCGGFPCQAFSISGRQDGFLDERGKLFHRIEDILKHKIETKKPVKIVFLENVRNFGKHDGGNTFTKVKSIFEGLGYMLASAVIDSGKVDSPTKRQRIYLVAVHASVPKATPENMIQFESKLRRIEKKAPKPIETNTLRDLFILDLKPDEIEVLKINEKHLSPETPLEVIRLKDQNTKPTTNTIQIGSIQQGRQGERIYSTKCQAITFSAYGGGRAARTGAYYINGVVRRLHPKECAKIMGFERDGVTMDTLGLRRKGVSDWQLYKQFGNSVVVPVIEQIFELILEAWDIEKIP
jgi:DNA (cytosine-5)-methyltransferase 1